jgi:type 1 glutamine amidotransferase
MIRAACLVSTLLVSLCVSVSSAAEKAQPLKGLLITGGCCHDYENQKRIITEGVSQRANVTWDIVHEGGDGRDHKISVYAQEDWAKKYDFIVHNECFGETSDPEFVQSIVAHHEGVPAIFIHCSLHSYRKSTTAPAWRELIGVTSVKHESKHPVDVVNLAPENPIMQGFPAKWTTTNGELYEIQEVWPNCTPLAQAYGTDTKKDHVVIWSNNYGKTKVFGTSLGHFNEEMNTNEWLGVVSRGILWSCDKLSADGKPQPGYEGTGIQPIDVDSPQPDPKFAPAKPKDK